MGSGENSVSGPLAGPVRALQQADAQLDQAARQAAALWTDDAYRTVEARVLRPLGTEGGRFAAELAAADAALARALVLLGS